jgi:hypothetical protein
MASDTRSDGSVGSLLGFLASAVLDPFVECVGIGSLVVVCGTIIGVAFQLTWLIGLSGIAAVTGLFLCFFLAHLLVRIAAWLHLKAGKSGAIFAAISAAPFRATVVIRAVALVACFSCADIYVALLERSLRSLMDMLTQSIAMSALSVGLAVADVLSGERGGRQTFGAKVFGTWGCFGFVRSFCVLWMVSKDRTSLPGMRTLLSDPLWFIEPSSFGPVAQVFNVADHAWLVGLVGVPLLFLALAGGLSQEGEGDARTELRFLVQSDIRPTARNLQTALLIHLPWVLVSFLIVFLAGRR